MLFTIHHSAAYSACLVEALPADRGAAWWQPFCFCTERTAAPFRFGSAFPCYRIYLSMHPWQPLYSNRYVFVQFYRLFASLSCCPFQALVNSAFQLASTLFFFWSGAYGPNWTTAQNSVVHFEFQWSMVRDLDQKNVGESTISCSGRGVL